MHDFHFEKDDVSGGRCKDDVYRMLFHSNPNVMLLIDPDTATVIDANSAALEFYGYSRDDILGMGMEYISKSDGFEKNIDFRKRGCRLFDTVHVDSSGKSKDVRVFSMPIKEEGASFEKLIYMTVLETYELKDEIDTPRSRKYLKMALHDEFTELPNRRFLKMRVGEEMDNAKKNGSGFALLFIDMDDFKIVNDNYGHVVGDELLSIVGERLRNSVRGNDFASRFGGDEFGIILSGIKSREAAMMIAKRIVKSFEMPFEIDGNMIDVKCSMGLSVYPEDGEDFNELVRAADMEMYNEKKSSDLNCVKLCMNTVDFYK